VYWKSSRNDDVTSRFSFRCGEHNHHQSSSAVLRFVVGRADCCHLPSSSLMYAQFQSFQHVGAATTTQQPGLIWNGSSWVPAAPPAAPSPQQQCFVSSQSGVSSYQQPLQVQSPAPSPDAVVIYTKYYHEWTRRADEQRKVVEQCTTPNERTQAQGHYDWYKYYADQASRAANWFYSNPGFPAPFDLPPAPPPPLPLVSHGQVAAPSWSANASTQQHPQAPTVQFSQQSVQSLGNQLAPPPSSHSNQNSSSQSQTPDSLKRYVDRCLMQCNTSDEKLKVMSKIEEKISSAILNGTLHSKNWDDESMISLEQTMTLLPNIAGLSTGTSPHKGNSSQANSYGSQYGPSSPADNGGKRNGVKSERFGPSKVNAKPTGGTRRYTSAVDWSDSHSARSSSSASDHPYGPQTSSPKPSHTSSQKPQQSNSEGYGYYGPTSTPAEDFISLPKSGQKRKVERKDSGFNQSVSSLSHRAKRFARHVGTKDSGNDLKSDVDFDRYMGKGTIGGSNVVLDEEDYENMKVKGKCLTLEKDYLRLTAPPRAELVRPQHILEQHLKNLKAERQLEPSERRDYLWFCSQLKAVRQDCTVQHIQNAFSVNVYETHARIALEEGDLNEYNQCQTQLKELYSKLEAVDPGAVTSRNEFIAYRLLYYVFLTGNHKYDGGSSDLFKIMTALTSNERCDPAIQHALQVRVAVSDVDYHKYFQLRKACPNLGLHLMDLIVPGMRYNAILRICNAYRPSVEVNFVLSELGFDSPNEMDSGIAWLASCGCLLSDDKTTWNTKDTAVRESDLVDKNSLI
jgi:SAC3 family protein LENG8/THP3